MAPQSNLNQSTDERKYSKSGSTTQSTKPTSDQSVKYETVCDECGGKMVPHDVKGEYICNNCSLVVEVSNIDYGPEWRSLDEDGESRSRVGAPLTEVMHDKGLSTEIGSGYTDANGNRLSSKKRTQLSRLRKWHKRSRTQNAGDSNLAQALTEIQRMGSALGISNQIQETAGMIYRRCLDENLLIGRSIEGVATAALYTACRQCNSPRSLNEFYPVSRVASSDTETNDGEIEINRTYRYIVEELGLKMEPVDPETYLTRFISRLNTDDPQQLENTARVLCELAKAENIHSGVSPTSIAGAAIYAAGLITGNKHTQKEVGKAANISTVTIRNQYREIIKEYSDK